ncbi:NeuD/PglB/VioB family sugar acetyltransferase [Pseudomonas sp. G2-4]|uniref:NeuD/PglB/VioB family sugar acetyltransferase n=1 Tax=Pseudomonas sp. G2-4 TaxID=1506334 RepID=UPI0024BA3666|nr:NeuD/PglB/VioB family sugar acetyltransferase [Pseudomonas sp. G2-4]WHS62003.1 NeuD/PglB/VioB family sugar acetyltransferase [Pseudomonas sp. G2-4]
MNRLAILGASGHGKVVADTAECSGWDSICFFDDAWPSVKKNGIWSVVGNTDRLLSELETFSGVVVAIGDNRIRQDKLQKLLLVNARLVTLIHPAATVSRYATIGAGSVVFAGVVVNVGVRVGLGAILNTGCSVDHDCVLGDSIHISPGAHLSGGVTLGDRSWIGVGACIRQQISIGCDVVVGAGAAVVNDIASRRVVAGVPAKQLKG